MIMSHELIGWLIAFLSILLWAITFLRFKKSHLSTDKSSTYLPKGNGFISKKSEKEVTQDSIIYFASSLFRQNTIEDILWDICINCVDKLDFVDCVIYLVDEEKEVLVQKAAFGPKNDRNERIVDPIEIPIGSGIVGSAFENGKVELIRDVRLDSRYILDDQQRLSELSVPIITPEGKTIGIIDSEHPDIGFFTTLHVTVLSTIASICAIKLVRAKADKDLLIAKERAEEATRIKSQFLSTMSHEIRNPLNAVIGMSHLLMDENPSPAQLEHIRPLHLSSKHLLSLVNDILDYSKLEVGKVDLDYSEFDLANVFEDLKQSFLFLSSKKGVTLNFDAANTEFSLIGDVLRVNQILNNLIGNAIKFTDKGDIQISASLENESSTHCTVVFKVIDTGIGIEDSNQEKIFSQFEQLGSGKTRKYEGAGLGLSICKKLVDLQGGEIGVTSKLGEGSEFWFKIPFEKGTPVKKNTVVESRRILGETLKGMKVLLVEDHLINQKIVSKLTQKWKVDLAIAENGSEALDTVLKNRDFDLILMDLHMPVVGGVEATKLIRSQEGDYFQRVPIIALTADVSADVKEETLSIGMNDFITKPFDPVKLYEVLKKFYSAA